MKPFIQPYQFNFIEQQTMDLLNTYRSVNDTATINTIRFLILDKIDTEFADCNEEERALLHEILTLDKTSREADRYLEQIKAMVIPLEPPTDPQLKKLFAKTKKLKIPNWSALDLKDYTFYGWNDGGKQRKYMIARLNGKWVGVQGILSPEIKKGICPICHKTSEVALFMANVKATSDGAYTNRGNYICHDSEKCNHQIKRLGELERFIETVRYK